VARRRLWPGACEKKHYTFEHCVKRPGHTTRVMDQLRDAKSLVHITSYLRARSNKYRAQGQHMLTSISSDAAAAATSVAALPGALPILEGRSRLEPTLRPCPHLTGLPIGPTACRLLVFPIIAAHGPLAPTPRRAARLVSSVRSAGSRLLAVATVLPLTGVRAPAACRLAYRSHGIVIPPEGSTGGWRGEAVLRTRLPLPPAATTPRSWLVPVLPAQAAPKRATICERQRVH